MSEMMVRLTDCKASSEFRRVGQERVRVERHRVSRELGHDAAAVHGAPPQIPSESSQDSTWHEMRCDVRMHGEGAHVGFFKVDKFGEAVDERLAPGSARDCQYLIASTGMPIESIL